jgi:NAD(P)-dependent dehydrogenase (short-subunit alcohol dehydrogenase family)
MGAYSASKLFMLMFSIETCQRLRETQITVNALHPGIVRTQMMLRAPGFLQGDLLFGDPVFCFNAKRSRDFCLSCLVAGR